jgi:ElaB/YqjD/DUF883 family membrane-anchored ribosome-binding protein
VEELNRTVAQLRAELSSVRDTSGKGHPHRRQSSRSTVDANDEYEALRGEIQSLSDEVVRQRDKLSGSQSEVSALRSRLVSALERARKAEALLEESLIGEAGGPETGDDVEHGASHRVRGRAHRVRQRGGGRPGGTLGRSGAGFGSGNTMRSALKLDGAFPHQHHFGGFGVDRVGRTLDAADELLAQSGKFLKYNPLARLLFVAYLLVLHLWTFAVLAFHAHGMESIHGDFAGSAVGRAGHVDRNPPLAAMAPAMGMPAAARNKVAEPIVPHEAVVEAVVQNHGPRQ